MDFLPYVYPGAAHFLLIGQSAHNLLLMATNLSCLQPARKAHFRSLAIAASSNAAIAYFYNNRYCIAAASGLVGIHVFWGLISDYTAPQTDYNRKPPKMAH
jgi:hypothetical protein